MSLTINGYEFPSASDISPATSWGELRHGLEQTKPRVARTNISGHSLSIVFKCQGDNVFQQMENLQGLFQQGQVLIISSGTQRFWGNSKNVICTAKGISFSEEAMALWKGTASLEFRGNVGSQNVVFDVSSTQDFNDYELAGRSTIGLPAGVTYVVDPGDGTNLAITSRGSDPIITNYDGLDTGTYVLNETKQTSLEFAIDPVLGFSNTVKVSDETGDVMNTDHVFVGDIYIYNGQQSINVRVVDGEFDLNTMNFSESFSITGGLQPTVKLLALTPEYVALRFDSLILELMRGKDLVVHVLGGVLVHIVEPGTAQTSGGSDNALQIGGSGIYVASNAYFKTTTGQEILPQDGADPNESVADSPRYQIFEPDGDLSTRKLDVLKRLS